MFHIFRWRRERLNDESTQSDSTKQAKNKLSHVRRARMHVYRGRRSIERLFHVKRNRSHSEQNKQQVIINPLLTIQKQVYNHQFLFAIFTVNIYNFID